MRTKTIALAAGGALALTALGGVAVAVPQLSAVTTTAATEAEPADDPGDAAKQEERRAERASRIGEQLAGLVADGTITQEQADAVASTLAAAGPAGRGGGNGHGPGGNANGHGPGANGNGHGPGGNVLRQGLATAAETLGLEEDALRDRLKDGETLGEVADAEGVGRDDLVAALVATAQQRLAEEVAAGELTQAEADEISAGLTERLTEALDRSHPGARGNRGDG